MTRNPSSEQDSKRRFFRNEKARREETDAKAALSVIEQAQRTERVSDYEYRVPTSRLWLATFYRVRKTVEDWTCNRAGYQVAKAHEHVCRHLMAVAMIEASCCLTCRWCEGVERYLLGHEQGQAPYRCPASVDKDREVLAVGRVA